MNKKENYENPVSCWNKAEEYEEMFILLGRDPAAPVTIRAWWKERIRLGLDEPNSPKIVSAQGIAQKMASMQAIQRINQEPDANDFEQKLLRMSSLDTLERIYNDPMPNTNDPTQNEKNAKFQSLIGREIDRRISVRQAASS